MTNGEPGDAATGTSFPRFVMRHSGFVIRGRDHGTMATPSPTPAPRRPRRRTLGASLNGLIFVCIMLFMGVAAINSGSNLLYAVFGLMIGVLVVAAVISRWVLGRLAVHRVLPDHGTVGRAVPVTYRFENRKRFWPSLSVTAAELDGAGGFTKPPQGYLLHAAAGATAAVVAEVIPARRGLHRFDRLRVGTSFPFGFVRRSFEDRQPDKLLVFPPVGRVDPDLVRLGRAAEHLGSAVRPRPGGQDEFYGVKEHRPGDNPRHIHWRRSARTAAARAGGTLVAKEMTTVAPPRLLLLVDTWLADRTKAELARVEQAIAMAASVASAALEEDQSVGLVAWDGRWRRLEPSRGKLHRSDLLSVLAGLPANPTADTAQLLAEGAAAARGGTTAMLFTPRDVPPGAAGNRDRGAPVVVAAGSPAAAKWFTWDPPVDFAAIVPRGEGGS